MFHALILTLALAPAGASPQAPAAAWLTPAEASDHQRTPRLAETMAWFEHLAAHSDLVATGSYGQSPAGRPLPMVVVARGGEFEPAAARASGKEIVLIQAAIHGGENEGKDALMAFVRDIAVHGMHHDLLEHVVLVLLPVFNVDGHERFSPYNRINQNGPEEMGWRVTANNLNLNRDFAKADAPEMQAWLALWNQWQPDLLVDMHNTNGADYQYALTWAWERAGNLHPAVAQWQQHAFGERVAPAMEAAGWPLFPYVSMVDPTDLQQGLVEWASSPRYSTGYAAARNRAGLLLETHMLKDFRTRTRVNERMLLELLRALAADPGSLRRAVLQADADTVARAAADGARVPVAFTTTDDSRQVDFLGYAYSHTPSDVSGATWVRYDPTRPQTYSLPMRDRFEVEAEVTPPAAYVIPAAWQEVIGRLRVHGIRMHALHAPAETEAWVYRFSQPQWSARPIEGRQMLEQVEHALALETVQLERGAMVVAMDQPLATLAIHLLEPAAPDALLRWGLFNAIFEDKEYAEPRVMEAMAREMLEGDPALAAEFEARLADPDFASSPRARLRFFYARTPYFDQALNRYPVVRLDRQALDALQLR